MTISLYVGAAQANITPDGPLSNYNGQVLGRSACTLPLQASVLIIRNQATACLLISIDATFIDESLTERIRQHLTEVVQIPPENTLIAATHSHATPATCQSFLSGALPSPEYLDFLVKQTGRAAQNANEQLRPASCAYGSIENPIGWCRRWVDHSGQAHFMPEKPLQPGWRPESSELLRTRYLAFKDAEQRIVAMVLNIPCHNNFVFETYHADFFGWAGEYLREQLNPDLITVTLPAPSGDIACRRPEEFGLPGDAVQLAEEAGRLLGKKIHENLSLASTTHSTTIQCRSSRSTLPDRSYDESDFCHDDCRGNSDSVRQRIRSRYDPEEAAIKQRGSTTCNVELQCIALGDVAIISNPAELFSAYDNRIQAGSPFAVTLVSELSNGYCGYVPTPEAFSHGCYETHRTVCTSRLSKDAGEQISQRSIQLLEQNCAAQIKQ